MIDRLRRVPLREVWKHEAIDFTRWLQENLDVLNDALDLSLIRAERERAAGTFNVDLVAEDEFGNSVIIENQLERTDHDHLGKLITYLTALEAKTAIWICADPRPEHIRAISWLNECSPGSFYLVKVEAVQIGDSPPAPLLTRIVEPSEESREIGEIKRERSDRKRELSDPDNPIRRFWAELLERAKVKTNLHASISPSNSSWIGTTAGRRDLLFVYWTASHRSRVDLYCRRGREEDIEGSSTG